VALIGVMTTWSAQPAEYNDDSTTLNVNASLSLLMMFSDLLALMPSSHIHTHTHTHSQHSQPVRSLRFLTTCSKWSANVNAC